jgi:hypothetical protein
MLRAATLAGAVVGLLAVSLPTRAATPAGSPKPVAVKPKDKKDKVPDARARTTPSKTPKTVSSAKPAPGKGRPSARCFGGFGGFGGYSMGDDYPVMTSYTIDPMPCYPMGSYSTGWVSDPMVINPGMDMGGYPMVPSMGSNPGYSSGVMISGPTMYSLGRGVTKKK